jgi:hypothetical protein
VRESPETTRPIKVLASVALAWLTLFWTTQCSRQLPVPASTGTVKSSQLPFDRVSDSGGISPTSGFAVDGIPVGTEITIRLQAALSSTDSRVGNSFDAVIDDPVIVSGKTVVPAGALVTGSVLAARASQSSHQPGYLRVTLASLVVNGKAVPLRTSSIFAKGASYGKREAPTMTRSAAAGEGAVAESVLEPANGADPSFDHLHADVRFSTGQHLTFRLAQPLHL